MNAMSALTLIYDVVLPITIIIACYTVIWMEVLKQRSLGPQSDDKKRRQNFRLTKRILIIIVAYIVTLTPYYLFFGMAMASEEFRKEIDEKTIFNAVAVW